MGIVRSLLAMIRAPRRAVKQVGPAEAKRLAEAGALVVDVREGAERRRGRIAGSIHIPLSDLAARAGEIPTDRPVVVHCALGARSAKGAAILAEKGFTNVVNLDGGYSKWEKEGLPTEK